MRVLHVNAGNLYGGIETLLATLARRRALCPGVEPQFALFFEGRHADELRAEGVPVHLLGGVRVSRPWTVLRARWRLRRLLAEFAFDVVVTHGCWNHVLAAPVVRRRGSSLVYWAHMIQGGGDWLERWARRSPPDLVLANSQATAGSVKAHLFPRTRSEVFYLPVSPPSVPDRAAARYEKRRELGTPENAVVIVMVGRMEPLKGHPVLLAALGRLRRMEASRERWRLPGVGGAYDHGGRPCDQGGWECWVVGGAQRESERGYERELREQAVRLGVADRVRFLGQRSDVALLLAAADVYCQPNTSPDSFGITFVEALYAGLPVVTSAIGGALEVVNDRCGILVPPGDEELLSLTLQGLLMTYETRAALAAAGPARAAELCDPEAQMGRLSVLLREVGLA